jgi:hypothetical protein
MLVLGRVSVTHYPPTLTLEIAAHRLVCGCASAANVLVGSAGQQ